MYVEHAEHTLKPRFQVFLDPDEEETTVYCYLKYLTDVSQKTEIDLLGLYLPDSPGSIYRLPWLWEVQKPAPEVEMQELCCMWMDSGQ